MSEQSLFILLFMLIVVWFIVAMVKQLNK